MLYYTCKQIKILTEIGEKKNMNNKTKDNIDKMIIELKRINHFELCDNNILNSIITLLENFMNNNEF